MNENQKRPNKSRKPAMKRTKNYMVTGAPLRELIDEETQLKLFKMTVGKGGDK